jgi:hypothetical protein
MLHAESGQLHPNEQTTQEEEQHISLLDTIQQQLDTQTRVTLFVSLDNMTSHRNLNATFW